MSKGIIVLDLPENCMGCQFRANKVDIKCSINHGRYIPDKETKPEWCPIKPAPERKPETNYPDYFRLSTKQVIEKSALKGYNKCLDDVLGDTDG